MGQTTPYVVTKAGRIHTARCGVGGHGLPLSLDALLKHIDSHPYCRPAYYRITAECCGACPDAWLARNHPERWDRDSP